MKDHSAKSEPADAADAVVDGLEPNSPLADAVERHLADAGGPVEVDERALKRAVASASARIAAGEAPRPAQGRTLLWVAAAAVLAAAVGFWMAPPDTHFDPGPGIAVTGAADLRAEDEVLLLDAGYLRFERHADGVQPRYSRVHLAPLDAQLIPVGTIFEVWLDGSEATLHVIEGRVQIEIGGRPHGQVGADATVRITAAGLSPARIAEPPQAVPVAAVHVPAEPTPVPAPATEAPRPDALTLLLLSEAAELDSDALVAAIRAADRIGSVRPLVPLGPRLDPDLVTPAEAPVVWLAKGRHHEASGRLSEALIAYERVDKAHWTYPWACLARGRILAQLGELDGARKHLDAAVAAAGRTEPAAHLALAEVHLSDGKPDHAMWAWRRSKLPSSSYDALRVKTQRLSVQRHASTWKPQLAAAQALIDAPDAYQSAVVRPGGGTPVLHRRLAAAPTLIELAAERRALLDVDDPSHAEALSRAQADHDAAGELATRRALADLADEIRRALP